MNRGINLLGKKIQTPITKATEKLRILRTVAISLLFIVSASSVIIFLLIALSPLPSLQKKEKNALKVLSAHHADMAKLEVTKERLSISSAIINKRNDFSVSLQKIIEKMPAGISINAIKMKDKNVSITALSSSLSSLETFLDNLTKASDQKKDFASVAIKEYSALSGQSTFTLKIDLIIL